MLTSYISEYKLVTLRSFCGCTSQFIFFSCILHVASFRFFGVWKCYYNHLHNSATQIYSVHVYSPKVHYVTKPLWFCERIHHHHSFSIFWSWLQSCIFFTLFSKCCWKLTKDTEGTTIENLANIYKNCISKVFTFQKESGLEINFLTHLQSIENASIKTYLLKWNHFLLKFRSSNFKAKVLVAENCVREVQFSTPCLLQSTSKMGASECYFQGLQEWKYYNFCSWKPKFPKFLPS